MITKIAGKIMNTSGKMPVNAAACTASSFLTDNAIQAITQENVKLTAYPLVKIGDILWTYMGDPATQPRLPEYEFALVPEEQTYTSKRWQQCNWLQAFEGGIDSSHVTFLHSGGLKNDPLFKGAKGNEYNLNDTKPFFEVADSEGGLFVATRAELPLGAEVELKFALPNGRVVQVHGTVRWRRAPDDRHPLIEPGVGIQFGELGAEDLAAVREFVAQREPILTEE